MDKITMDNFIFQLTEAVAEVEKKGGSKVTKAIWREWEASLRKVVEAQFPEPKFATGEVVTSGKLFTTHDVAKMLQVDASTVSKWIDRKILIAFRTPGGHRRVRDTDFALFLKQHDMPIPSELLKGGR